MITFIKKRFSLTLTCNWCHLPSVSPNCSPYFPWVWKSPFVSWRILSFSLITKRKILITVWRKSDDKQLVRCTSPGFLRWITYFRHCCQITRKQPFFILLFKHFHPLHLWIYEHRFIHLSNWFSFTVLFVFWEESRDVCRGGCEAFVVGVHFWNRKTSNSAPCGVAWNSWSP